MATLTACDRLTRGLLDRSAHWLITGWTGFIGYAPTHGLENGIRAAMPWYVSRFS